MTAIPLPLARAAWMERQGLDEPRRAPQPIGGWMRAIGGVGPYLSMLARDPKLTRPEVDRLFADGELRVVPGVRGCIWTVRSDEAGLAVAVASAQSGRRLERDLEKAGSSLEEARTVGVRVVETLAESPASTRSLASALPDDAVRSLGDAGKKVGITTTLPPALRLLEFDGTIARRLESGRLEGERYEWFLADGGAAVSAAPTDPVEQASALARLYFDWAGPSSFDDFVRWSGVNKGPAKKAVAAVGLVEVEVEELGACLCLPEQAADVVSGIPLADDEVHLLPTMDNLLTLRQRPGRVFAAAVDQDVELIGMGSRMTTVGECNWLSERPLFVAGRWAGVWDWDAEAGAVIWAGFRPLSSAAEAAIEAQATRVARFVRDDLDGQARTTSIDGDKSQRRRVERVRTLRGG